jgi:hypothetical protein
LSVLLGSTVRVKAEAALSGDDPSVASLQVALVPPNFRADGGWSAEFRPAGTPVSGPVVSPITLTAEGASLDLAVASGLPSARSYAVHVRLDDASGACIISGSITVADAKSPEAASRPRRHPDDGAWKFYRSGNGSLRARPSRGTDSRAADSLRRHVLALARRLRRLPATRRLRTIMKS